MIARSPIRAPAKTIACARIRAPGSMTSGSPPSAGALERADSDAGLAEHDAVLDQHAVTDHDVVVHHDIGAEHHVAADRRRRAEDEPRRPRFAHGGYPTRAVTPNRTPLRGAVLGLGMIGRHHARLLRRCPA